MTTIFDESGQPILDEADQATVDEITIGHRHVLAALTPIALGPNFAAEQAIDGDHLDQVQVGAQQLLSEMFPDTCSELIDDWERLLGLPDVCTGRLPDLSRRVAAVAAKWAEKRQLSAPALIGVAQAMGFAVTITNYAARRYGQAVFGTAYCGRAWANTITITAPDIPVQDRAVLECTFARLRPAHVYLDFNYS